MWITLTTTKGDPVLVSSGKITHVTPRESGGSSLYFDAETPDGRPRVLGVSQSFAEVAALITGGVAPAAKSAAPAPASKRAGKVAAK